MGGDRGPGPPPLRPLHSLPLEKNPRGCRGWTPPPPPLVFGHLPPQPSPPLRGRGGLGLKEGPGHGSDATEGDPKPRVDVWKPVDTPIDPEARRGRGRGQWEGPHTMMGVWGKGAKETQGG